MSENPKDVAARERVPLWLLPGPACVKVVRALLTGATKYGPFNWRSQPINAMTYTSAAIRHIKAWEDGENLDPESGQHSIAHAIAGLMILLDAEECGMLLDNRPPAGPTRRLLDQR